MGDINLSEMKATYYPPKIQPGFMGAHAPIKQGYGSMYGSGNTSYFQNFRNENISRMQVSLIEVILKYAMPILSFLDAA